MTKRPNDKSQQHRNYCELITIYYENVYILHCCQRIENCRSISVVFKCFTLCVLEGKVINKRIQWIHWRCVLFIHIHFAFSLLLFALVLLHWHNISLLHQTNGVISILFPSLLLFFLSSILFGGRRKKSFSSIAIVIAILAPIFFCLLFTFDFFHTLISWNI